MKCESTTEEKKKTHTDTKLFNLFVANSVFYKKKNMNCCNKDILCMSQKEIQTAKSKCKYRQFIRNNVRMFNMTFSYVIGNNNCKLRRFRLLFAVKTSKKKNIYIHF